jgi:hypothetical protein
MKHWLTINYGYSYDPLLPITPTPTQVVDLFSVFSVVEIFL